MKKGPALIDTGPLVSFLASGLTHHLWTCDQWKLFRPPLLTCEPVLTEAAFLLKREGRDTDPLFALLERGALRIAFNIQEQQVDLRALMHRYRNRPMSLADACLVRLSELHVTGEVFTLDSDFHVYRRHGNKVIPDFDARLNLAGRLFMKSDQIVTVVSSVALALLGWGTGSRL